MKLHSIYDLPEGETKTQFIKKGDADGVLYMGVHFYDRGVTTEPHSHDDHEEIFINVQGRGKVVVDGVEYEFNQGSIVVISPGEEHYIVSDDVDPLVNIYMGCAIRK